MCGEIWKNRGHGANLGEKSSRVMGSNHFFIDFFKKSIFHWLFYISLYKKYNGGGRGPRGPMGLFGPPAPY